MRIGALVVLTVSYHDHAAGAVGRVLDIYRHAEGERAIVSFAGDVRAIPVRLMRAVPAGVAPP